jgi:ribosomal protein L16/L10AE
MSTYFVEGTIKIKIDVEIEANSLEEAEQLAFKQFKKEHPMSSWADVVEDSSSLMAGKYEDEDYND